MDNPRLILYLALGLVLFMIWQTWQQDYGARPMQPAQTPAPEQPVSTAPRPEDLPAIAEAGKAPEQGAAAAAQHDAAQRIRVVTDVLDLELGTRGGDLLRADLLAYPVAWNQPNTPFRLFDDSEHLYIAQSGLVHDKTREQDIEPWRLAPSHHDLFTASQQEYRLQDGQDELQVSLAWQGPNGVHVNKVYTFHRGSYLVELEHVVINQGQQAWVGRQYRQLRHGPVQKAATSTFIHTFTGGAYYDGKYEKVSFEDMQEEPLYQQLTAGWVAVLQHYFVSAWVPEPEQVNLAYTKAVKGQSGPEYLIGLRSEPLTAAPGETVAFHSRLYLGPKLQHRLAKIAEGLELVTDYGILTVIAKPLFWLLEHIHAMVGNWGWAIILVTVLIKLAFYKLSETSYRSMAKMRSVQPRLAALKDRYAGDKQKLNQALMELYKKEKINPLGGCLPIVVQIPVFIALYWTLLGSVELRQAPFMFWIHDLSTRDPYFVLPVLMGITMFAQQRLNPTPLDPIQAKVMMALPIVFTVFFAFFPSGLVLYWFVNNLLSILQQWAITRRVEQAATAR
jgi:YidC/Oxa1 family membrane protein insertase